jgi:hypothetical protein
MYKTSNIDPSNGTFRNNTAEIGSIPTPIDAKGNEFVSYIQKELTQFSLHQAADILLELKLSGVDYLKKKAQEMNDELNEKQKAIDILYKQINSIEEDARSISVKSAQ